MSDTTDYKNTVFLPTTSFPMRGDLPKKEPKLLAEWQKLGLVETAARELARAEEIHPARRAALRQRPHPYRHRAQQDPERRRQPRPPDGWLRRRLRPRMGLPRPADRVEDRGGLPQVRPRQGRGADHQVPRRMPRLRAALDGCAGGGIPAPGRARRFRAPLRDDGFSVRGRDCRRDRQVSAQRRAVSRAAAGDVEPGRKDGTRRGRGRVPRPHLHDRVCSLPDPARDGRSGRGVGGDLDHDALDHAGQPRHRLRPRDRLRRRPRGQRGRTPAGRGPARCCSWRWRCCRRSPRRPGSQRTTFCACSRAPNWPASPPPTRCAATATTSTCRCCPASTSPPKPAPASCTPPPATARKTSSSAVRTTSKCPIPSALTARSTHGCRCSPACTSTRRPTPFAPRSTPPARCSGAASSCIPIRTPGAPRRR